MNPETTTAEEDINDNTNIEYKPFKLTADMLTEDMLKKLGITTNDC